MPTRAPRPPRRSRSTRSRRPTTDPGLCLWPDSPTWSSGCQRTSRFLPMRTALLIARGVAAIALAAVLVLFVALSVITQIAHRTGYPLFVIDGSSMAPSIARGGLAFEQPVDPGHIRVGDVVTVRQGNQAAYTHRVADVVDAPDGLAIQTKGDANTTPDPALVPASAVVGRVIFWV